MSLATITWPLSVDPTILSPVFVSTGFSIVGLQLQQVFSSSFGLSAGFSTGFKVVDGVVVVTSSFLSVVEVVVEVVVVGSTSSFFLSSAGFSSFGCSVVAGVSAVVDFVVRKLL